MNTSAIENIDLGRPLTSADIVNDQTYPIDQTDSGKMYCHVCDDYHSADQLQPLTSSSGVFTAAIRCEMNAPVWVFPEQAITYPKHNGLTV